MEQKLLEVLKHFLSLHEAYAVYDMINLPEYTEEDVLDYIKWCDERYKQDLETDFDTWKLLKQKHGGVIKAFLKRADEFNGECHIIWLPAHPNGGPFNNVLPGPRTDILAAYLNADGYMLQFFTSSPDDRDQRFVSLGELPFSIQKQVIKYIIND